MDFFDYQLPTQYSLGAKGGPCFSTETVRTSGGAFYANRNWTMPLHMYDISESIRSAADFQIIRSIFYNVYGQFSAFRFKDHADYICDATNSSLTLITGATYQLNRVYAIGARTFTRPILKPISPVVVTRTRSAVTSTASASIDYTTGIATISGHVALDTYTWAGQFDVPVGFTTDHMEAVITKNNAGLLVEWPSIVLEERR